jgi:uncharacterized DUF497 family protein
MIHRVIALLIIVSIPNFAIGEDAQVKSNIVSVNKTLTREIDVIGDGIPEQIVLNLRGESWQKPFKRTLTIKAKGKVILKHQSDDTWLDTYFADKDYVLDCADYLFCKKKYYEEDILRRLVVIDDDLYRNEHVFEKNNPGSIQIAVRKELEAQTVFLDENAIRYYDPDHSEDEDRFIMLGMSFKLRVLVVCHCYRLNEKVIRIVSARKANKKEAAFYWR